MLKNGYIKMHRSLLDWEWYDDINTTRLFLHLILTVNYEDKQWQNETIKRGSRVSSYRTLAHETHLSERQVRTAVKHLELTGELTRHKKPFYTVFTINNYDKFQEATGQTPKKRQGNDKNPDNQTTSQRQQCKNINKNIRNKEESPVRQEPPGLMAARGLHINEGGDF